MSPKLFFCPCFCLHPSSFETSSLLTGSTPQPQLCRTVAAVAAVSSIVESGKVCHLSSSTGKVWNDDVSCVLPCQYLFLPQKPVASYQSLHQKNCITAFQLPLYRRHSGSTGTGYPGKFFLLFPPCTGTREGGHCTTAT